MNHFTAYFTDCNAAHAAAFEISEGCTNCGEIIVGEERSENAQIPSFILRCLIIGALLGYIVGTLFTLFPSAGFFSRISTVCGIISGSVIGTLAGMLIDLTAYELTPVCSVVSFCIPKNRRYELIRRLKRRGAVKISISK